MSSFEIQSKFNKEELNNAVDKGNREVATRFDFKGSGATYEYKGNRITLLRGNRFSAQASN